MKDKNGNELVMGCVWKGVDGYYRRAIGFLNDKVLGTEHAFTLNEALNSVRFGAWWESTQIERVEIVVYPVIGKDKNGTDLHLFDKVGNGQHSIVSTTVDSENYVIIAQMGGSDGHYWEKAGNLTFHSSPFGNTEKDKAIANLNKALEDAKKAQENLQSAIKAASK